MVNGKGVGHSPSQSLAAAGGQSVGDVGDSATGESDSTLAEFLAVNGQSSVYKEASHFVPNVLDLWNAACLIPPACQTAEGGRLLLLFVHYEFVQTSVGAVSPIVRTALISEFLLMSNAYRRFEISTVVRTPA